MGTTPLFGFTAGWMFLVAKSVPSALPPLGLWLISSKVGPKRQQQALASDGCSGATGGLDRRGGFGAPPIGSSESGDSPFELRCHPKANNLSLPFSLGVGGLAY